MRSSTALVAVVLAACGFGSKNATTDAGGDPMIDAPGDPFPDAGSGGDIDAAVDAAIDGPGCQPTKLLTGGMDVVAQGWTVVMQAPATLSNVADYTKLETSTQGTAANGGRLLLSHAVTIEPGKAFKLQIEMQVERVDAHNAFDSPAAILGSFTEPDGGIVEQRAQMIYLDGAEIGWADDTEQVTFNVTSGGYHTYDLAVDGDGNAELRVDGVHRLSRVNFLLNGTIAIGDQTVDPKRDSTLRIRSVTLPCL